MEHCMVDMMPYDEDRRTFMSKTTRRDLLKASGAATGAAMLGVGSAQAHGLEGKRVDEERDQVDIAATNVTVTEGTNVAPTLSPDGESIVMDLHGILFRLPREGGHAEPLTDVELEPARPDYAPDGNRITFQAYVDGNFDIWTMAPDGSDLRQLTDDWWDDREPKWSPDGTQIAFSSDRGEGYDIWTVDVATGELQQWTDTAGENYEPTWSPDGMEIAYITDPAADSAQTIKAVDQDGDTRTLITAETGERLHSPSWSPDGDDIAYVRQSSDGEEQGPIDLMISGEQVTDGEDVFIFTPDWLSSDELLYSADGDIRVLELASRATSDIPFSATFHLPGLEYKRKSYFDDDRGAREVQGILTPTLSPDGEHVAFVALNDLWVMRTGRPPRRITNDSAYQVDPAWSPDGRYLAYSSDKAGTQELYVHDMQTGTDRQVTSRDDAVVSAAWSPDGSTIAFQNQNGATLTIEVDIDEGDEEVETGEIRQVKGPLFAPGKPTWSADGTTLAMAALHQYSDRFREGTSQILTVNVETGEEHYYPPGSEFESIATRANDGPVWSPDGRWMAFVVDSTLRVMPVTDAGEPAGPAEQITSEATDAPTWSGDSKWLLYLNNGQLKKVKRDGSVTKEVPVRLTYQPEQPADRTVIYVGKLWDGTSPEIHENVTIEVVNDRIQNVTPDSQPPSEPYVDASDLTVIPGLWDNHVHRTISARFFGDRQGRINLAYGVTSILSRGDLVYRAIEGREALTSGNRIGPRYFASGELIDGSRIYYNCMRSVTSKKQIPLEMSRAQELDYDFVKTYVRLNAKLMAEVTDIAHELGVPAASHYLAPGALVGQNGTTHLSATQRLGYARTESATSQTYEDIIKLYGQGERSVTTTFFTTDFLLAEDIEDDPRTQLFPPWTRENLWNDIGDNTEFPSDPDCDTTACRHTTTFKNILDRGGVVLTGTDAPLVYFGLGVHGNLRPLVEYAFSPYEALLTATRLPAEHLGVDEDLGTLEPGKLADMVFVDGNPLEQIEDAMQVRMTMKNGELFTIQDLVEPFEETSSEIGENDGDDGERATDEDDENTDGPLNDDSDGCSD
jgi:Tol biopolymer transport system component